MDCRFHERMVIHHHRQQATQHTSHRHTHTQIPCGRCRTYLDQTSRCTESCRESPPANKPHARALNNPLSGTIRVSRYQKGKTSLDFTGARDSEWHWHQLGHMHVCTSLQTDNHAITPPLSFYRPDALPVTQPTASKHRRQYY